MLRCLFKVGIPLELKPGNQLSSRDDLGHPELSSSCGGNLGYILELQRGRPFKTRVCSATLGLLSSYEAHLRNLFETWQGHTDAFRGEAGDPGPLCISHNDIGIPIHSQEESGIIIF